MHEVATHVEGPTPDRHRDHRRVRTVETEGHGRTNLTGPDANRTARECLVAAALADDRRSVGVASDIRGRDR